MYNSKQLGEATIEPQGAVIAGALYTWTIRYTVGSLGIDSGGQIKVAHRLASDWGSAQFDQPLQEGYCTVTTNGRAKIRPSWQPRGYIRPYSKAIVLDIYDGSLDPGDEIMLVMGDTSQGSLGMRAQTYIESAFEFLLLVDPTNSTDPRLAETLNLQVVAAELYEIACIVPSQCLVGENVEVFTKGEDLWRNPIQLDSSMVQLAWHGDGEVAIDEGVLRPLSSGTGYVAATYGEFECRSNPMTILAEPLKLNRFWGDLHAQTGSTVGVGTDDEYFQFGRDWGKLDFMSHQGNDFQIDDALWAELNRLTEHYNEDGRFVVFPGYEWSGSSPTGGDHNIIYRREGRPILRSSHWLVPDVSESELSPAHPADVFYDKMKQAVPADEVIVCQHVGGRYANLRKYFDQELISLVELVSDWGVFEWMLWDAIDRDYIVGVMCNSDGHHGRPGAEGAGMSWFGIRNGLTCVLSEELTRESIFTALKQRRCYGTTGDRIVLEFTADGHQMGSVLEGNPESLNIQAAVIGTAPLESLQLYAGRELIAEKRPAAFDDLTRSNHIRVSWQGSRERGRQRRVTWDGAVRVEGAEIQSAVTFSFDVVADGIVSQSASEIVFGSKTTGDRDGLDIVLDQAKHGRITFDSAVGKIELDLVELTDEQPRRSFDFGGVDMQVIIERYPEVVDELRLELCDVVRPNPDKTTAYFVKTTQTDGQMAWSSPVWVKR